MPVDLIAPAAQHIDHAGGRAFRVVERLEAIIILRISKRPKDFVTQFFTRFLKENLFLLYDRQVYIQ